MISRTQTTVCNTVCHAVLISAWTVVNYNCELVAAVMTWTVVNYNCELVAAVMTWTAVNYNCELVAAVMVATARIATAAEINPSYSPGDANVNLSQIHGSFGTRVCPQMCSSAG